MPHRAGDSTPDPGGDTAGCADLTFTEPELEPHWMRLIDLATD